jgi:hypothetical protein
MIGLKSPNVPVLLCCSVTGLFGPACAQETEPPTTAEVEAAETAPLFASDELLLLTIEADFHTIRREDRSDEDSEERPAIMRWTDPDGTPQMQEIQIQTRGRFRLARRNCDFPPLRVNVKKKATEGTLFDGQDKLKLVVTCKLGQEYWEQYVLSEYMVYRIFNLFTPMSFRVRLARVTYVDTSGEDETIVKFGVLIEDDDAMATRNRGWKVDWNPQSQFHPMNLQKHQAILIDVFQYMIANTDFSGVQMHNMELIQTMDGDYYTVPFDFDMSGIVNARYATPDERLDIRSVRDRLFRGFCPEQVNRTTEDYDLVFEEFRQKKEEVYDLWRNLEGFEPDRLEDTLEFLDEFYETLEDPGRIKSRIMDRCRDLGTG